MSSCPAADSAITSRDCYPWWGAHVAAGYLKPQSGCPRCSRQGCFVCILLPGGRITWTVSPPQAPCIPLVAAVFRTNGYCVNAVQLHVNAADLLVRRGMERDGSR